jgi:hypothetical protein
MDLACSYLYRLLVRTGIVSHWFDLFFAELTQSRPWWLVRHGKIDEARASILRLTSKNNAEFNVEDTLAMMIHTNELEIQQTAGTSYLDCFKGVDLRRTELTIMTWVIQQTSGSPMMGWGTYFLLQVGLSGDSAYSLGIGQSAMGFVGTVASWVSRSEPRSVPSAQASTFSPYKHRPRVKGATFTPPATLLGTR